MAVLGAILLLAYLVEVLKGVRTPLSYAVFVVLCVAPVVLAQLYYMKKKDAKIIRYILGIEVWKKLPLLWKV